MSSILWQYSTKDNTLKYGRNSAEKCKSTSRLLMHSFNKILAKTSPYNIIFKQKVYLIEENKEEEMEFILSKNAYERLQGHSLLSNNCSSTILEQFIGYDGNPIYFKASYTTF